MYYNRDKQCKEKSIIYRESILWTYTFLQMNADRPQTFMERSIFDLTNYNFVVLEFRPGSTEGVKAIIFPNLSEGGWERCIYTLPS